MGPNVLAVTQDLGAMGKVQEKVPESDSALAKWRCTLETDEGAFELKSVLYDYAQPLSPNASTAAFTASTSASPRAPSVSPKEPEEGVSPEERAAAMVEALQSFHEAAARAADTVMFRPNESGVFSALRSLLFGERHPTPWWMRKNWKDGDNPRGFVAKLSVLMYRNDVRVVTTAGVLALVSVGVQKYISTRA